MASADQNYLLAAWAYEFAVLLDFDQVVASIHRVVGS